jgi:hypothetical protein
VEPSTERTFFSRNKQLRAHALPAWAGREVEVQTCSPDEIAAVGSVQVSQRRQYVEVAHAMRLMKQQAGHVGYLLKDRVLDVPALVDAMQRVAAGESVIERSLVQEIVSAPKRDDPLADLTPRERERSWR